MYLILLLAFLLFIRCGKEDIEIKYLKGYVVGYVPCTVRHQYRIGYVIISEDEKDTLETYNLSDRNFTMPASIISNKIDTLYKVPESYFQNFRETIFFPMEARYKYSIKISYKYADKNEMVYNRCATDIIFTNLPQILIFNSTIL